MRARMGSVLWLLAAGCIGGPVVGERGENDLECRLLPPPCSALGEMPSPPPFPEAAFVPAPSDCLAFAPLNEVPAGEDELRCAELTLDIAAETAIEVRGAVWEHVFVRARGGTGATLRFADTDAKNVQVWLEGEVWVEVTEKSQLDRFIVEAAAEVEGRALTIDDAGVKDLAVRLHGRGELRLEGARLEGGAIDVADLVVAESELTGVHVRATDAILAESSGSAVELELDRARIVSSRFERAGVHRCGSLRIVASSFREPFFAACDEPLILADTAIVSGRVLGSIEASGGLVDRTLFSPGPGGALSFARTEVDFSTFCGTDRLTTSQGALVCVSCAPDIAEVSLDRTFVRAAECPALEVGAGPM